MKNGWVMGLGVAISLGLGGPAAQAADLPGGGAGRPNILLILADDLGYSDIGPYGGEIDTPNLERLASEGLRLTNFHVAPTCSPTRSALMSGTDHHLAGIGTMVELIQPNQKGQPGYEGYLNDQVFAFPELLRDAGYHTYLSGKWHLGLDERHRPKARGFEESFALLQGGGYHFKAASPERAGTYVENDRPVSIPDDFFSSDTFTDRLIGFIDKHRTDGKPFFAYAAYTAPHWPLQAPPALIAKYKGRYDAGYASIRAERLARLQRLGIVAEGATVHTPLTATSTLPDWNSLSGEQKALEARRMETYAALVDNLDHNIGRLIQHLKDIGQYENTAIFFLSDNGAEGHVVREFVPPAADNRLENIGKASSYVYYGARWAEVGATPFRLSKGFTSEGGVTSPAIARLPGAAAGGNRPALATVQDLAPTFLALAGVPDPGRSYKGSPRHPITGKSLLPYLQGRSDRVHPADYVLGEELFGNRSLRQGDWKLLWTEPPVGSGRWELYNLADDPGETRDLAASRPEIVTRLQALWDGYVKTNQVVLPVGDNLYLHRPLTLGN